mmetsp:Transcript_13440/g.19259  ORF Transcript_13440/g.19259 Transcript_13440/m.19259 type:complete len:175 (-) Transcript_13440:2288-2812(-)
MKAGRATIRINPSAKVLLLTFFATLLSKTCGFVPSIPTKPAIHISLERFGSQPRGSPLRLSASDYLSSSLLISSATDSWVQPVAAVLDPTLNFLAFAMICRVITSWYPSQNVNEFPLNIVAWPTEPLLKILRPIIPPAFGVDITPIVWFGIFTFLHEILLGQQGLFTMKIKYWS